MVSIDTQAILSDIYGAGTSRHLDLYERSNAHRIEHGEAVCTVYPSSPASAPMWSLLANMVRARRFLEVGCGLGYTAALMAEAGGPESRVETIENVSLHADLAEQALSDRGLSDRVRVLRGEAIDIIPLLADPYDIVFIDADWSEYPVWLPHLTRLTRQGGILVTSNLFPLFEEWAQDMPHKEALRDYLKTLVHDSRFTTYIVPDRWQALSYRT